MNISQSEKHGVNIFTITGRIDTQGAHELENELQSAVEAGNHKMVLDLSNVRYINSSALRTLADVLTENRDHGGDLYLVGMAPRIRRVFEIIGFDKFFVFHDSVDDAVHDYDEAIIG